MEFKSRNTNTLMIEVIRLIQEFGISEPSRNGPVLRFPEPVTICITHPWERVNFSPVRDGNPFFHLIEALAMLGGLNDAPFLAHFAKNMMNFSDDGQRFNAFYGWRLRRYHMKAFPYPMDAVREPQDQLAEVIQVLQKDPLSRQAVTLLWDPADLMFERTKDKACNLMLVFANDSGRIRMTSYNRSNDAIWGGVMGANIVHLSFFHEYVAQALGLPMGEWWHHSNNLHVYEERKQPDGTLVPDKKWRSLAGENDVIDAYPRISRLDLYPLFVDGLEGRKEFEQDLHRFLSEAKLATLQDKNDLLLDPRRYTAPFIKDVALPMFNAWQVHKNPLFNSPNTPTIDAILDHVKAVDWRLAGQEWMNRRHLGKPSH